jgi:hypothetical protein
MKYGPHHLHALRVESPARARIATPLQVVETAKGLPAGEPHTCDWSRDGHALRIRADRLDKHTAYLCLPSEGASPEAARRAVMRYGLDLYAAMLEDGLRSEGLLLEQLVLAVVDWDTDDVGLYVLGDNLMQRGRVEYRRAMASLDQAVRDGWPNWLALGVQLLDIGTR